MRRVRAQTPRSGKAGLPRGARCAPSYNRRLSSFRAAALSFFTDPTVWLMIVVALVAGGLLLWPTISGARSGGVSPAEAVRLINREKGVLVDVREPAEYAAGHAVGARNVPLSALDAGKGLPTNKALPVVVLCETGARATRAVAQLQKAGYERAVVVAGGTGAWRDANLPIEKSA